MVWRAVEFDDAATERIKQAAKLERTLRLRCYVSQHEDLGWTTVRQITPRDCVIFELDENRIFCDEKPQLDDFIHLAYLLKVDKKVGARAAKKLVQAFRSHLYSVDKTIDFVNQTFIECPGSKSTTVHVENTGVWLPSLVDCIASEYGWKVEEIMDMPIKTLFLQMAMIKRRVEGNKASVRNPITQQARANELNRIKGEQSNG